MVATTKELITSQFIPATLTSLYQAPTVALITALNATNTSTSVVTVSANLVPSGGTAGDANQMVDTRSIAPGRSYQFPELHGHNLETGASLHFQASAANAVSLHVSGVEIT